jgi:hypothetical protein
MFRLTVAPPTGFDYLDGGDDAGGRNLYKQLPRTALVNILTDPVLLAAPYIGIPASR